MNYYPHHIGDFRSGTINMTKLERWIYRDMVDVYYDKEQYFPLDMVKSCDLVGARTDEECRIVAYLLRTKFIETPDGYAHERCDLEIRTYQAKADTAKANGKKGAATRYQDGEYMPSIGSLYAVRASPTIVKVGITANMKSRLHQLRSKYGKHAGLIHQVLVSHMGNAEADLLEAYKDRRIGEELQLSMDHDLELISEMGRIEVAYQVASKSHGESHATLDGSHTNQEPITKNQKPRTKVKAEATPAGDALFPDVDLQVVADFKELRKRKSAPVTPTSMDMLNREAVKAGLTLEGAMRICCARGWQSLKAEWILKDQQGGRPAGHGQVSSLEEQRLATNAANNLKAKELLFGKKPKPDCDEGMVLENA